VKAKAQQRAMAVKAKVLPGARRSHVPTEKKRSPLKVAAISLMTMPSLTLIAKTRTVKLWLQQGQTGRMATVHAAIVLMAVAAEAVAEVEDLVAAVVVVEEARAVVAEIEARAAAVVEIAVTANQVRLWKTKGAAKCRTFLFEL
jgi:hypothetical protein